MEAAGVAWATAAELAALNRRGRLEAGSVEAAHRDRIRRLDGRLHAYIALAETAPPATAGPLAGTTLAVKDTQPVAGLPWTCGSPRWRERRADHDSPAVARVRAAGSTILGKTNLPELAASVGTANELFPSTENPWRAGFTPGGSSGGSGAAVAAGLCTLALGDDMGGSIRIPAACCGIAGLRPTPGRIRSDAPDPTHLSVEGPLARAVGDLRLALSVMIAEAPPRRRRSPRRIAVIREAGLAVAPACAAAARRAEKALVAAGHELSASTWDVRPFIAAYQVIRPVSVAGLPGEPERFGRDAARLIARGRATGAGEYVRAMTGGMLAARPIQALLEHHDAVLTPTLGRLPMPIGQVPAFLSDGWATYVQFVLPVSFAGCPAVSVPAGLHRGLPVGVQLVGRPGREWELLDLAAELEAVPGFGFQRPPRLD